MKKISIIILIGIFAVNTGLIPALAGESDVSLEARASSSYSYRYGPDKTLDDDERTYWIGGLNQSPWWISFDAGKSLMISKININWYNHSYYIPTDYDIQISGDNMDWEDVYTGLQGINSADGETREINQNARYIRLYINSVTYNFPVINEFAAYSTKTLPRILRFQGRLSDKDGAALDGAFTLTFRLYDEEYGNLPIWEERQPYVIIEDGILDVELGSVTPLDCPFDKQYWLGVEIESDGEMAPRFKLSSVPYAIRAEE